MIDIITNTKEAQANYFALCLLMPKKEFITQMYNAFNKENYTYNMQLVADYFNVSLELAITRAKDLRMIK